jgi:hypothetical protein
MGLNYPKDQGTEWFNLKRQVKNAFTSANSRVPYQKIAAGILKVSSSLEILAGAFLKFVYLNGIDGLYLGSNISFGGEDNQGVVIRKGTGRTAFTSLTKVSDGTGFTGIWDGSGNIVVSDDNGATKGLARPWLAHSFVDSTEIANPPAARQTANTTDTSLVSTITHVQHPKMTMWFFVYIQTAPATAEIKVKNLTNGVTTTLGTFSSGFQNLSFTIGDWDFGDPVQLDVTARRASGSGNVGITVISWHGRQS